ncbi:hypothetical protein HET69_12365 [Streptomyces sp. CJ_13]|uniref:hypothetical protein n=1 Tax=Streptomyces sp. CJ_13 TaxID=2724943 RepID=UPI001BDBD33E|nr:hypothetical protein [Streptomyces sp. CJ_13]MBT1184807.1 hypothetical protein [Streptomyces sp. CJ_13]
MGEGYVPSVLFAQQQDVELAREARALSQAFADVKFCRAVAGGVLPPSRREHFFVQGDEQLRLALDGLLLALLYSPQIIERGPQGESEVMRLAGRVETFLVPSATVECQAMEYESAGEDSSFVVAISPLVVDIMAQLLWAMPIIATHYGEMSRRPRHEIFQDLIVAQPGGNTLEQANYLAERRALDELDRSVASYLRLRESGGTSIPFTIVPEGEDDSIERVENVDTYGACTTFLLAHELEHIKGGHFLEQLRPVGPSSFLAALDEEQRREVEADCSSCILTLNALIMSETDARGRPRIPDFERIWKSKPHGRTKLLPAARRRQQQARDDADYLARRVVSAAEAMLCFYAVMDILAATARRHGRQAEAERLGQVAERGEVVRGWLKWELHELEELWRIRLNVRLMTLKWESLDRHVDHIKRTVVDAWPNHEPPRLPWTVPKPAPPRWIKLEPEQ